MKVLSLFDGISCGMVAMQRAGVEVEKYDAFEIDKYAIQVSEKNYPEIAHHGDVFQADFKPFQGCDWLIGGSPCVFWSIAQSPNKRETRASGKGWELFSQYLRALQEAKPTYFLYENNDSMSDDIRDSITETFGFEPIMIDSALLSGQHRKRLYWIGKQSEKGFYEKCRIPLPKDKEILLKDILESGYAWQDKSYCITANYHPTFKSNLKMHKNTMVAEQLLINDDTISIDCDGQDDINAMDEMVDAYLDGRVEQVDVDYLMALSPDTIPALLRLEQAGFGKPGSDALQNLREVKKELHWTEYSLSCFRYD